MNKSELKLFGESIRRENRKKLIKNLLFAFVILILLVVGIKFFRGDYKFTFREVAYIDAIVTETKFNHFTKNYYFLDVYYEFDIKGELYNGKWNVGEFEGMRYKGDILKVKYAVGNPNIHQVIH